MIKFIEEKIQAFRTNDILILMGNDFAFQDAYTSFTNIVNLINYMNGKYGDKYHFVYSTP